MSTLGLYSVTCCECWQRYQYQQISISMQLRSFGCYCLLGEEYVQSMFFSFRSILPAVLVNSLLFYFGRVRVKDRIYFIFKQMYVFLKL